MGAYLSKPITDKISTDEEDDKIKIGASSMQGWRETQEDAHNHILDYDKNTYFFGVYDGHGGREVALYCSEYLPQFIKNTDAYKINNYENALIDGFLGFDASLTSEEVISKLETLMDHPKSENDDASDEENVNKLYEEASMPLDEVIEKYKKINEANLKRLADRLPPSPFLKACKGTDNSITSKDAVGNAPETKTADSEQIDAGASTSFTNALSKENNTLGKKDDPAGAEKSTELIKDGEPGHSSKAKDSTDANEAVSTNSNKSEKDHSDVNNSVKQEDKKSAEDKNSTSNKDQFNDTKPLENGNINKEGRGKVSAKTKGVVVVEKKERPKRSAKQLYLELLEPESESDSEDEDDKTFQGPNEDSSDDEEITPIPIVESDESSDDDIDEEDEEEEEEDEEDEDDYGQGIDLTNDIPGSSSGCTAVVALLCGTQLFVANAGDSRCIVCRNGEAIDMSIDHKPEDAEEYARIVKAGGRVNSDGRVNGGLNLSRAIGDHSYKLNKDLPDKEQVITALPDVKTYTLTSADEFMVLACDGIWNFMSSQEVADFVKCRLDKQPEKLSQICEEMFDNCLAPHTLGDGTGCDNMTAIIINFKNSLFKRAAPCEDEESNNSKRAKTDQDNVVQETSV